ncbi:DUF2478 domain-containing protein [Novosphingobium album (ex Hu et al. 2023)]|uniref:DUF2478 domain-containing protein n=1 Tax=Novosphingobium album (ex Hu et al. 2023) TaxID=2930093 RepID=A0ABT0AX38_9SPHN|nr:DUF2478 domain-containing protein [Novosphingobium album (ex Hu et al. 2023)]MCJ2177241.1 DUF2478 domain-containing protein [Novosphingobium album (ex Hu et al. 2023)]
MIVSMFPVGVVEAESSKAAQELFRDFTRRWQARVRIGGVIESSRPDRGERGGAGELHFIGTGAVFRLYHPDLCQDGVCNVDPQGAALASHTVEGEIASGCDLVILNKFGKLEAARAGLLSAFMAAIGAGVPVLTYVSPGCRAEWARFADPLFCVLEDRAEAIDAWWHSYHAQRVSPA